MVSGAWGEQGDHSRTPGGSLAFRLGCAHSSHRRKIAVFEGELFF